MDLLSKNILIICAITLGLLISQGLINRKVKRKRLYAIEPGGLKRLQIISDLSWRKTKIYFDGVLVKTISNRQEFLTSQELQLPDKSILRIKLSKLMFSYYEVQVWRNGEPLHNFEQLSGPLFKVAKASSSIMVVGLFPIIWLVTVITLSFILPKLFIISTSDIPYIISIVLWGLLFFTLAFFGHRHSLIALFLATAIYLFDGVLGTILYGSIALSLINSRGILQFLVLVLYLPWWIGFLVFHIIFLVPMVKGYFALLAIKRKDNSTGLQIIVPVLLSVGLAVGLYWAMMTPQVLSKVTGFYSQLISPLAKLSPTSPGSTPIPIENLNKTEGICWTNRVNEIEGNRSQTWENLLNSETKALLPFDQFKTDVVAHNPQLIADGYIFYRQKFYYFPIVCQK